MSKSFLRTAAQQNDLLAKLEQQRQIGAQAGRGLAKPSASEFVDPQIRQAHGDTGKRVRRPANPTVMHDEDRMLVDGLKARVFGQDEAIDELTKIISIARAGISEPGRPLASALFLGPTGVGKTELVEALSAA